MGACAMPASMTAMESSISALNGLAVLTAKTSAVAGAGSAPPW